MSDTPDRLADRAPSRIHGGSAGRPVTMSRAAVVDEIAAAVVRRLADPAFLDLLADHLTERLAEHLGLEPEPERESVDAAAIARRFGLTRGTVYDLARRGVVPALRIGDGPRPRWRFDPEQVADALTAYSRRR